MKVLVALVGCLCLAGVALSLPTQQQEEVENFQILNVHVENEEQLIELRKLKNEFEVSYLEDLNRVGRSYDIGVNIKDITRLKQLLAYLQVKFDVTVADAKEWLKSIKYNSSNVMSWTAYHDHETIYSWMNNQCIKHRPYLKCKTIGYSYEGRAIRASVLSKRPGNKVIFMESNIHAIEWISSATLTYIMNELLNSEDPVMQALSMNYDWSFSPISNPDGHWYTHNKNPMWRKNRKPTGYSNSSGICYGTDLNRNFGYEWGNAGYNFDVPCDHWYGGNSSDSEPEVLALEKYAKSFGKNRIGVSISLHSYGQFVLLPYGHTTEYFPPNYDQMLRIAKSFTTNATIPYGTKWNYGASGLLSYVVSGSTKDYNYGALGVPFTCTLELRDRGTYGFMLPASQILEVGEEVTTGLIGLIAQADLEGLLTPYDY